jgi:uncharacterized membrane protein
MKTGRLEAFSDGVLAIIITIMVLELKVPHAEEHAAVLADLAPLWPVFLSYVLSFIYLGIYWNNHHHMLQITRHVDGRVLWANLHLLFWLSLFPFATAWMGENHFEGVPIAVYGVVLLMAGAAYKILLRSIIRLEGAEGFLRHAVGRDVKGSVSVVLYALAVGLAFVWPWTALVLYVAVACMWLVPDRRIERAVVECGD